MQMWPFPPKEISNLPHISTTWAISTMLLCFFSPFFLLITELMHFFFLGQISMPVLLYYHCLNLAHLVLALGSFFTANRPSMNDADNDDIDDEEDNDDN